MVYEHSQFLCFGMGGVQTMMGWSVNTPSFWDGGARTMMGWSVNTHGFCVLNDLNLAGSPVNTLSGARSSPCMVSVNSRMLTSSPVASMPNFTHTAGHNVSRHVRKSSSMLQPTNQNGYFFLINNVFICLKYFIPW